MNEQNALAQSDTKQEVATITPRIPITIRVASETVAADLKFIDDLHKKNTKGLGFWHLARLEGYLKQKKILIAESAEGEGDPQPLGFIIATDRYHKRDDVGCIYAVCVDEVKQRSLIGAMLVQAVFERAAYGCKLFCCWCAQDLDAGYFWESVGFVPIAFRTGSENAKGVARIHIFWQKRIRSEDADTPYWYPSITQGGVIQEGRLVLPIPPGTHWSDPKPMVLPEVAGVQKFKELEGDKEKPRAFMTHEEKLEKKREQRKQARELRDAMKLTPEQVRTSLQGGMWFATPEQLKAQEDARVEIAARAEKKRAAARKKSHAKREYSEEYLTKARDLCAVYLEQLQQPGGEKLLAGSGNDAKYDVRRQMERVSSMVNPGVNPGANPGANPSRMIGDAQRDIVDMPQLKAA